MRVIWAFMAEKVFSTSASGKVASMPLSQDTSSPALMTGSPHETPVSSAPSSKTMTLAGLSLPSALPTNFCCLRT